MQQIFTILLGKFASLQKKRRRILADDAGDAKASRANWGMSSEGLKLAQI
jgi:hypothetical protein